MAAGTDYGAADGTPQTFTVSPATYTVTVTGSQAYDGQPTFAAEPVEWPEPALHRDAYLYQRERRDVDLPDPERLGQLHH